jgi:hypothetical protein
MTKEKGKAYLVGFDRVLQQNFLSIFQSLKQNIKNQFQFHLISAYRFMFLPYLGIFHLQILAKFMVMQWCT